MKTGSPPHGLGVALGWYLAAKLAKWFDGEVLALTGVISGHTLKHLLARVATMRLLKPR